MCVAKTTMSCLQSPRVESVDRVRESVGWPTPLGLESAEHSVPDDQRASVVLVDAVPVPAWWTEEKDRDRRHDTVGW